MKSDFPNGQWPRVFKFSPLYLYISGINKSLTWFYFLSPDETCEKSICEVAKNKPAGGLEKIITKYAHEKCVEMR